MEGGGRGSSADIRTMTHTVEAAAKARWLQHIRAIVAPIAAKMRNAIRELRKRMSTRRRNGRGRDNSTSSSNSTSSNSSNNSNSSSRMAIDAHRHHHDDGQNPTAAEAQIIPIRGMDEWRLYELLEDTFEPGNFTIEVSSSSDPHSLPLSL